MAEEEKFDFVEFVSTLEGFTQEQLRHRVREELARMEQLVVREPGRRFQQQIYLRRVKRLARFLAGQDVARELAPSEIKAYAWLVRSQSAPAASAAPARPPQPRPEGKTKSADERRRALRIRLKTRVRIRRERGGGMEVVEPLNVSRGGLGFESARSYGLHEVVWVEMHYRPGDPQTGELETRALVVRAAPLPRLAVFSYGLKFLERAAP